VTNKTYLDDLERILAKDPTIHTFDAEELIKNPQKTDQVYRLHADTHMSLGQTEEYVKRILSGVIDNKKAFVGGLVGEYGYGKTSLLTYLWKVSEDNMLLAVPPYSWEKFEQNFHVLHAWAKYKLTKINQGMESKLDDLYSEYAAPAVEREARRAVEEHDMDYDAAYKMFQEMFEEGTLILELNEEMYLDYCQEVSELAKTVGFKGLIVFTDELQRAIDKNSLNKVASIWFNLSDRIRDREGNFGLFVGMPLTIQATLLMERSDIFDRLQSFKAFIDLSTLYGANFPIALWGKYSEYFDFKKISNQILDHEVLVALGQITDGKRRDLGNGPRSVISAFNRIVWHFKHYDEKYTVNNLSTDIMNREIILGEKSVLIRKINELLSQSVIMNNDNYQNIVKILAMFPNGCSQEIFNSFGLEHSLEELMDRVAGELMFENANGFALITLQPDGDKTNYDVIEQRIITYLKEFAADRDVAVKATQAFGKYLLPKVFSSRTTGLPGWTGTNNWQIKSYKGKFSGLCSQIEGTFENTTMYPQRQVELLVMLEDDGGKFDRKHNHFQFRFKLHWDASLSKQASIMKISEDSRMIGFALNLMKEIDDLQIPTLNKAYIHKKHRNALCMLGLVYYLKEESSIPKNEVQTAEHIVDTLIGKLFYNIFDEDVLRVYGTNILFENRGMHLLRDAFDFVCKRAYPEYSTLIAGPQWDKKISVYVSVLQRASGNINVVRGKEPLAYPKLQVNAAKDNIAALFNIKKSSMETWAARGLENLLDLKDWQSRGMLWFKVHPLEQWILTELSRCSREDKVKENGKWCNSVNVQRVIRQAMDMGYTEEEVKYILLQIGVARKYFSYKEFNGEPRLYQIPISIEELKDQLDEKLNNLHREYSALQEYERFRPKFRFDEVQKKVEKLSSEEDFESIKQEIHAQFEIHHKFMTTEIYSMLEALNRNLDKCRDTLKSVEAQGLKGYLGRELEGKAIWIKDLSDIQAELRISLNSIESTYTKARQNFDALSHDIDQVTPKDVAQQGVAILNDYSKRITKRNNEVTECIVDLEALKNVLLAFRAWEHVIEKSDQALRNVQISRNLDNKLLKETISDSFDEKFDTISDEIKHHLKIRKREGLKGFEDFSKRLDALSESASEYITQLKRIFLQEKKRMTSFLEDINVAETLLRANFSEANPQEAYEILYDEVQEKFGKLISELERNFISLRREVDYSGRILDKTKEVSNCGVEQAIHSAIKSIEELKSVKVHEAEIDDISQRITILWSQYREIRDTVKKLNESEELNYEEQKFFGHFPKDAHEVELKEIILRMTEQDSNINLDEILHVLKELFKKNKLNLKVRRIE